MKVLLNTIDMLAAVVKSLRPLNDAELKRLREEFVIEATYNSNAIEGNTLTLRGQTAARSSRRDRVPGRILLYPGPCKKGYAADGICH